MSFTYNKNNKRPSMDPCGTPHVIFINSEVVPATKVHCFLSVKLFSSQEKLLFLIPSSFNLARSISWFTVSKAFEKSIGIFHDCLWLNIFHE